MPALLRWHSCTVDVGVAYLHTRIREPVGKTAAVPHLPSAITLSALALLCSCHRTLLCMGGGEGGLGAMGGSLRRRALSAVGRAWRRRVQLQVLSITAQVWPGELCDQAMGFGHCDILRTNALGRMHPFNRARQALGSV
jgi:hypothetical protein